MSVEVFIGSCAAFTLVAGTVLCFGILWYANELPDSRRTLTNRLNANHTAASALLNVVMCTTILCMYLLGGGQLPEAVCDASLLTMYATIVLFFVNADVVVFLKCVYIFSHKGVALFHEELAYTFLTLITIGLPMYWAALLWFCGRYRIPFWYRCVRMEEGEELDRGSESLLPALAVALVSLVLHLAAYATIYRKERSLERATSGDKKSFVNFKSNLFSVVSIIVVALVGGTINVSISKTFGISMADMSPFMVVWNALQVSVLLPCLYYRKNPDMRRAVVKMFRESLTWRKEKRQVRPTPMRTVF